MALVYKSICNEADTLYLHILKLTEDQIKVKLEIEKLMNKGFVNIAKARYIMGSTCVTKMQLPTENSNPIQPVATVTRKGSEDNWFFNIHRKDVSSKSDISVSANENLGECLSNGNCGNNHKVHTDNSIFKNVLKNDPKSLKKSKDAYFVEDELYDEYKDELLDELSTDSDGSLISVTDPIRLFGILVPSALKEAQVYFKDVVDLLGKSATIQHELRQTLHKYNHIERVKRLIEVAAEEIKMNISEPKVYWTPSERSSVSCISYHSTSKDEDEDEDEDLSEKSKISVQKSIRSVFYEVKDDEAEENMSLWSQERLDVGSED